MAIEHLYNGEKRFDGVYNVIRLTSTRELCRNKSQHKYSSAVLYGGLKYDEDDETMIAESRSVRGTISSQPAIFRGFDNSATRKGWEYLPGTLEEVNQISSIISKNKIACEVYTSGKGNEESFKALSGNDFDILHIATHGFYMTVSQAEKMISLQRIHSLLIITKQDYLRCKDPAFFLLAEIKRGRANLSLKE